MSTSNDAEYWLPLKYASFVNDLFCGSMTIFFNFLLVILVKFKTPKDLKFYRRILILNIIIDTNHAVSVLVTQTKIDFDQGVVVMLMHGPFSDMPNPITWHLINWWVISLFASVMFLPVPFIFRYFSVCREKILNRWQFALLIFICITIALGYGCLHAYTFVPDENSQTYAYIINHEFWTDSAGNLPTFIVSDPKDKKIFILISMCCFLSTFSYIVVITCNVMIYKALNHLTTNMDQKNRELQKQLSRVLKYQALIPLLICVLPLSLVLIFCALGFRTAGKGVLLTIIVAWMPLLNSLAEIFMIRQYRQVFTRNRLFKKFVNKILPKNFHWLRKIFS